MLNETGIETQLKDAVALTQADWAVHAERIGGSWLLRSVYRLGKPAQNTLVEVMSTPAVDGWLCGALSGGYVRSAATPDHEKLNTERFYAYPIGGTSQIILVGAKDQNQTSQKTWRLTASLLAGRPSTANQPFLPDLQSGLAFNMPLALEKVLGAFVQAVECQGAWLAIRRGESLDVQAEWKAPKAKGMSLVIDDNPVLRRVNRSLADVSITRGQPNWNNLPYSPIKSNTNFWMSVPLVIGQRLIGIVVLWRRTEFTPTERGQLREVAARVPPSVEVVVTYSEMTSHLRRLALLNDFVLTVSSAQNLDQIARRMFGLLSRAFNTESIALFLRSSDGRVLRDYRMSEGKLYVVSVSLAEHPLQSVLVEGRVRRMNDSGHDEFQGVHTGSRSGLVVPLKYRGQVTGVLIVESLLSEAFSQYDEHLMVVIASHLAGLIEYTRLREEAEGRARSLGLIHEVVQEVIGLNDKKEVARISADLVAQYFKYEMAVVLLVDDQHNFSIQGLGGAHASTLENALAGAGFIRYAGVSGRVTKTGESMMINDTSQEPLYVAIKGWEAGSEICVAIKDGGEILGIIDVESREQNAFAHTDLIAMESLAGILASVVSSANQYQKLQETVRQLRLAEIELNARMVAQKTAESKLLQAAKLAAVGEMAAGIAHELNNPLTTVTGFSELMLDEMPSEASHRDELEMVLHEARRASDVVRRLLDFSRQGEQMRTSADINEVVHDVIALTRHLIMTNQVNLSLELDLALPWVSIDTNQMKQVLLNLIHNALQAMKSGGEMVVRTYMDTRDGKSWIVMSVQDNGLGIPIGDQAQVFQPFFTTKGNNGGTGLGLSVSYGIVTDHAGTIELASEPGQGSTFAVWLPLEEV